MAWTVVHDMHRCIYIYIIIIIIIIIYLSGVTFHSTRKSADFVWNADNVYIRISKLISKYKIVKYKMKTATYAVTFAGCVSTCINRIFVPAN